MRWWWGLRRWKTKVDLWNKHLQLRSNRPDLWCVCRVNIQYIYIYMIYDRGWIVITCKEVWVLSSPSFMGIIEPKQDLICLFYFMPYSTVCCIWNNYCISIYIYIRIFHVFLILNYYFKHHHYVLFTSNVCFLVSCTEKKPLAFLLSSSGPLRWRQNWIMRCSVLWRWAMVWVLALPVWKKRDDLSGIIELPILGGIKQCKICKCPVFV